MPSPGRPPKPTALKILEGNPGKRPLNHDEPKPTLEGAKRPPWLNYEAKRTWTRLYPELQRLGLLTVIDVESFCGYCEAWAEVKRLTIFFQEHERTVELPSGYLVARPEVKYLKDAWAAIRSFASDYGLTPSSRSRIKVEAPKEVDPFEEYLSKGTG